MLPAYFYYYMTHIFYVAYSSVTYKVTVFKTYKSRSLQR